MDYEAHITISRHFRKKAKVLAHVIGFSYSEILGDPDLGNDKTLAYLNGKFATLAEARANIYLGVSLCQSIQIPVYRSKIELIVDDVRYQDATENP